MSDLLTRLLVKGTRRGARIPAGAERTGVPLGAAGGEGLCEGGVAAGGDKPGASSRGRLSPTRGDRDLSADVPDQILRF